MDSKKKVTRTTAQINKIANKDSLKVNRLPGNVGSVKGGEANEVNEFRKHININDGKIRNNVETLMSMKEIAAAKKKLEKGSRDLRLDEKQIKGRKRLNDPARNRKIPDRRTGEATGPNDIAKSSGRATRGFKRSVKEEFKNSMRNR